MELMLGGKSANQFKRSVESLPNRMDHREDGPSGPENKVENWYIQSTTTKMNRPCKISGTSC